MNELIAWENHAVSLWFLHLLSLKYVILLWFFRAYKQSEPYKKIVWVD